MSATEWYEATIGFCSDLIRHDTQLGGPGERRAAEFVAEFVELARTVGLTPTANTASSRIWATTLEAVQSQDPTARCSPFMLSGGTDDSHLHRTPPGRLRHPNGRCS